MFTVSPTSEIRSQLHAAWANHGSTAGQTGETMRLADRARFLRAAAHREVEHRAKQEPDATDTERDGGNISGSLGAVQGLTAVRRASVRTAALHDVVFVLH